MTDKIGSWFMPVGLSMLEARKLSAQVRQDQVGKVWSWLSGLVWLATVAILVSVWIGIHFEAPPPDKSQEKMAAAHAETLISVANFNALLAPDQELTTELIQQISAFSNPLSAFGQTVTATAARAAGRNAGRACLRRPAGGRGQNGRFARRVPSPSLSGRICR